MSHAVIQAHNLSKKYVIASGGERARYRTLQDSIGRAIKSPIRNLQRLRGNVSEADTFWALNDVSFDILDGEVTGIIGPNGAGKSTLLKILSRITEPTRGRVRIKGRVASLLEVGTGFHGELTGRENIFLNGAILGMKRLETARKFDEIVQFAGVERFVDTPVKRYSSGMYLRLAFAVAAHLDPEILIVDEVLAVGDMEFQRKSMGRMREVSKGGRTVLLVSHNMVAIESLCSHCVLLDKGQLVQYGDVQSVIREYRRRIQTDIDSASSFDTMDAKRKYKVFHGAAILDLENGDTQSISLGHDLRIRIDVDVPDLPGDQEFVVRVDDAYSNRIMTLKNPLTRGALPRITGPATLECRISHFPLNPGDYWIGFGFYAGEDQIDSVGRGLGLQVLDGDAFGQGRGKSRGLCVAPTDWRVVRKVS